MTQTVVIFPQTGGHLCGKHDWPGAVFSKGHTVGPRNKGGR